MQEENRHNPDDLLKKIQKAEEQLKKGKLKIFFGMCASVGIALVNFQSYSTLGFNFK